MGVYIKGMEMPKHCWSCCFHDEVDDCIILKESCMTVWGEQKRLDNCPLIEVTDVVERSAVCQHYIRNGLDRGWR